MSKELEVVKKEAWKSYEKARDMNQMEAAAMFLAQVERMITSHLALDMLDKKLNETDEMEDWTPVKIDKPRDVRLVEPLPRV